MTGCSAVVEPAKVAVPESLLQLLSEAANMWREWYGADLSNDDCEALSRRLLQLFGIELSPDLAVAK